MRTTTLGGLTVRLTGGTDGSGAGDGPLVVFFHGFGAPGDDLVPLGDVFARAMKTPPARPVRFAFPAAPVSLEGMWPGARAWWMIDLSRYETGLARGSMRELTDHVPDGLAAAREQATAMLDALQAELTIAGTRVAIGGFSQGAMLACDLTLRSDRPLAGLVLLSGTFICRTDWTALLPARRGLPVFQAHGEQDPLLPFAISEELSTTLRTAGLEVDWLSFRGGHEIPPPVVSRASAFLARVLAE